MSYAMLYASAYDMQVKTSDRHEPVSPVTTLLPTFPDSNTISTDLQVTARHVPSRPGFKTTFPTHRESSEVQGQNAETSCRVLPALSPRALNTPLSHPRMSESSESDFSHHPGKDSDDEGSFFPCVGHARQSRQQKASTATNTKSRRSLGLSWAYHG